MPATFEDSIIASILAFWIFAWFGERECKRRNVPVVGNQIWLATAVTTTTTVLFAKLLYVAKNPSFYTNDFSKIFEWMPGTLSLDWGAIFGIIAGLAYLQRSRVPLKDFFDAAAPGALVALALIALGQLPIGDVSGAVANVDEWRHLVLLSCEALSALIGSFLTWRFARCKPRRSGAIALFAIAWESGTRIIVDAFSTEATLLPGGYRSAQVSALLVLLVALWLLIQPSTFETA